VLLKVLAVGGVFDGASEMEAAGSAAERSEKVYHEAAVQAVAVMFALVPCCFLSESVFENQKT
jgi:hypothetical protein